MTEKHYFYRTCRRNNQGQLVSPSRHAYGFKWPEEVGSVVVAPDWDPSEECGHGLHGLRPGDQEPGVWEYSQKAVWMVCSYDPKTAVVLDGKIKVPSCVVEYVVNETDGARGKIPLWFQEQGITAPIYKGKLRVGEQETATVGSCGHAEAGDHGTAEAGKYGTAIVSHYGLAQTGDYGKATAGDYSFATSGIQGTSIAGIGSTASTKQGGRVQAGSGGILRCVMETEGGETVIVGVIGQNGLEPDILYTLHPHSGTFERISNVLPSLR